jgi:hypothetical protein
MADRLTIPSQASSYPSYPQAEGLLQPQQSSGQRRGSRSPYSAHVSFPEPQHDSASYAQTYIPPSQTQTTPNLTVPTHHHHERRSSHGHSPVMGSSSDSQRSYPVSAGPDTGGGSNFYPQPEVQVQPYPQAGGGFTDPAAQPHDWNAGGYDGGHDSRSKAPPVRPASHRNPLCRFPRCNNPVFFDTRVNEYREWCSDQHMRDAIAYKVEKLCNTCQRFPRRNGVRYCSNACRPR